MADSPFIEELEPFAPAHSELRPAWTARSPFREDFGTSEQAEELEGHDEHLEELEDAFVGESEFAEDIGGDQLDEHFEGGELDVELEPEGPEEDLVREALDDDFAAEAVDQEVAGELEEALRQGRLTVAATLAAGAGTRDPDALANLLVGAQHPDLLTDASDERLEIRETIVRPLLAQATVSTAQPQDDAVEDLQQGLAGSRAFSVTGPSSEPAPELLGFSEYEHRRSGGTEVQRMIDTWALNGLIDGGAMINVGFSERLKGAAGKVESWEVFVADPKQPLDPYHRPATGAAHWHYICPDPLYSDPARRTRWTRSTLHAALVAGEACALSVGQIIMLAGDHLSDFDDLTDARRPRWNGRPVSIMDGFAKGGPMAYTVLDLWALPPTGVLRNLTKVSRLERAHDEHAKVAREIRAGGEWRGIEAVVAYLDHLRSRRPLAELHLLAQVLPLRTPVTLHSILSQAVGQYETARIASLLKQLVVAKPEAKGVLHTGIGGRALKTILTGGWYTSLAVDNAKHFAPLNWETFEGHQRAALDAVGTLVRSGGAAGAQGPIPAQAIARTAYGLHFLTDAFSSGHMRVPRGVHGRKGSLVSGVMHDVDNAYGLNVRNGFGHKWRAFGDGYLLPESAKRDEQRRIMEQIYKPSAEVKKGFDANWQHVLAAVGAAFRQLHYEAQRHSRQAGAFAPVLKAARKSTRLLGDEYAPAKPAAGTTLRQLLAADVNAKLAHLKRHEPVPVGVGRGAVQNHPPLFDRAGELDTSGAYKVRQKKIMNTDAPDLRLYWHRTGQPALVLSGDFRESYHFARNSTGVPEAWLEGGDRYLLGMVRRLPQI